MYQLCELFQQIIIGQHSSSLEPVMLTQMDIDKLVAHTCR